MGYGFNGKLIDVDLSSGRIKILELESDIFRKWMGGRGLGVYLLWRELGDKWEQIDPLSSENLLLILTGPLTGYYPGMKTAVVAKSPESCGVVGSVLSSEVGIELKAAGYDGIIFRNKSDKPVYLLVNDEHIELRDASKYWGKRGSEFLPDLTREAHDLLRELEKPRGIPKEPAIMYIGPGGENMVRFASIMAKYVHAAGYGGYGAVMGSKKLKAIVVKGNGPLPRVANIEKMKSLLREIYEELFNMTTFRTWGTGAGGYNVGSRSSSEPIRNWQEEWHNNPEISVVNFSNRTWIKGFWGDYGCPVTCMKLSYVKYGEFKGAFSDAPDYELQAYLGTNLGIFEPEKIVYLSWLVDENGLDGINTGNILGFVAELVQRGIIGRDELGFDLRWGDVKAFSKLIEKIVKREDIGDILAEGTYRAAIKLSKIKNKDLLKYAVQVKGIGVGAHGIRSKLDYTGPLSYAVSVQGGDHTSVAELPARNPSGELESIFEDSAVICMFTSWVGFEKLIDFTNTITGWGISVDDWVNEIGLRILHLQRILLLLGGPDVYWDPRIHDDNPVRFYEPLPSGPYKGAKVTREEVKELRMKYYSEIGYDEYGLPRPEILDKLGIGEAKKELLRIKERLGI